MALLSVQHLSFCYAGAAAAVLEDVTFSLESGEYALLVGESGSGKTTLLRSLKTALAPRGHVSGSIAYGGAVLGAVPLRDQAAAIGYVGQDVDAQLVCATVAAELAFGLENLGMDPSLIRARVAEMAAYLGLEPLFDRPVHALSGGEKQLVNLAAAMVMRPRLLLLDEPCAQLDPLAGRLFIDAVGRLNRERGVTVLMVEHRAEEMFGAADRVLAMDGGRLVFDGRPAQAARWLLERRHPIAPSLPAAARIAHALDPDGAELPLDTGSGRRWFRRWVRENPPAETEKAGPSASEMGGEAAIEVREASFRYDREAPEALHRATLRIPRGGIHALVGGNGSGKSTLMKAMAGAIRPQRGRVLRGAERIALLPQEPIDLFAHDTVGASLRDAAAQGAAASARCDDLVERFALGALAERNPHDLSAGELQRAGLALVLAAAPSVLLLDEATRNLDAVGKGVLARLLAELAACGVTVVVSTHDLQFCAENAETLAFLFRGEVAAQQPVRAFFSDSAYYTTNPAIISRPFLDAAVTVGEVVAPWRG